jgi:hypothetical protein
MSPRRSCGICERSTERKARSKRAEIAARQRFALSQFQGPRDKALRVTEVIKMFNELKDSV